MTKRISLASGILVLAVLLGSPGPAPAAETRYYVSLGDSLAEGVGSTDGTGYAGQPAAMLGLTLVPLGCGGETTTTMINDPRGCPDSYPPIGGSQLEKAEAFLEANRGAVALVTIDLGADDIIVACPNLVDRPPDYRCIFDAFTTIETNLPTILARLRQAAELLPNRVTVPIVGMTYYDFILALWLQGGAGRAFALDTFGAFLQFNDTLERIYKAATSPVADVEGAFSTKNFKMVQTPDFGRIPFNVWQICLLTGMCSGGDFHANDDGYRVIAEAFRKVLP